MAMGRVDLEDAIAGLLFTITAGVSLGALAWQLFGIDMQEVVVEVSSIGLEATVAGVVSVAVLAFVALTNDWSVDDVTGWYYYAVAGGLLLAVAVNFGPVYDFVTAADWRIALTMALEGLAFVSIAYGG
jgi:hypothetical protein